MSYGVIPYGIGGGIGDAQCEAKAIGIPMLKDRIDAAVAQAEARLAAAKEAREIFKRNPDIERLLDIVQKGLF